MSEPARPNSVTPTDLPFEEALKKLEALVEKMESDDLPLESLLACFEEGTRLAKACQARLADAELKIQALEKTFAGEPVLRNVTLPGESAED